MKKVIAISTDIECSTLYDKVGGDLLSMAFVEILEDYTLGREFYQRSKATNIKYFSEKSERIHGFSYWKASRFPERMESILNTIAWWNDVNTDYPTKLIFYANGNFDPLWIEEHFKKEKLHNEFHKRFMKDDYESVLKLTKENFKQIPESKKINPITEKPYTKYSLRNVCDFLKIELDHHNALSDARAAAIIYCKIMKGENIFTGELEL